ncbi:MAG: SH3 domain-containing protein [Bacteroidaceae bacterium]|nr:SH3 domain-containing protein [Bacteroidaceae bacterium]
MRKIIVLIAILISLVCPQSFAFTKYVTNNLNLRSEANTRSYVLTVIPKGTAVTIDEDCDCKWVPVEYNGCI